MTDKVYRSKIDWWIAALILAGVAGLLFAAFDISQKPVPDFVRIGFWVVTFPIALLMTWILFGTRYRVGDGQLLIWCGPFKSKVNLADIESIKESRNPLSSPACSLDRLYIKYEGSKLGMLISPKDKVGFIRDLQGKCPQMQVLS